LFPLNLFVFFFFPTYFTFSKLVTGLKTMAFNAALGPTAATGSNTSDSDSELTDDPALACRFRQHVCFDNLSLGDSTKHNTSSYSLQTRHDGYHPMRRSRTFMVGVDEKSYSDYALVWLLTNMVDDGDQVVVVHVAETISRLGVNYQDEAKRILASVQSKNELNKAIGITLEYAIGRLHQTFQQMVCGLHKSRFFRY